MFLTNLQVNQKNKKLSQKWKPFKRQTNRNCTTLREILSARTADIVEVTDVETELKELKVTYVLLN